VKGGGFLKIGILRTSSVFTVVKILRASETSVASTVDLSLWRHCCDNHRTRVVLSHLPRGINLKTKDIGL
jgi:hypothetical protein